MIISARPGYVRSREAPGRDVAFWLDVIVQVGPQRDSKDPDGGVLVMRADRRAQFLHGIVAGEFRPLSQKGGRVTTPSAGV